jgi:hypothetical protein
MAFRPGKSGRHVGRETLDNYTGRSWAGGDRVKEPVNKMTRIKSAFGSEVYMHINRLYERNY